MIKTITIPEEVRNMVQKANTERDSRRDLLLYIMQNDVNIPEERYKRYEAEYNEKFLAFEQAKTIIEKEYIIPATNGKKSNWSLDYETCIVTINTDE